MIEISPDCIRVYISETEALNDPAVYDRLYQRLPDFRRKKADSYKIAEARNQSVAAFCLLMYGLNELQIDLVAPDIWNTLDYQTTETGKPYFAGRPDIHFSLSHTKGAVMCAISGSEVGCDIERIDRRMDLESVAARILTEEELSACRVEPSDNQPAVNDIVTDINKDQQDGQVNRIQPLPGIDPKEFFRIWTRKEAYSKYTGLGLKQIADRFDLEKADAHIVSGETSTHIWSVAASCDILQTYISLRL